MLLIADEVAVGFGRTGTLFACEQEGVTPDFLCLAKGITGGYLPLAATLTTETVYAAFFGTAAEGKTFSHGHTYGGNPLGAAVALASLQVFDDEATLERLGPKVARLAERLAEFAARPHVGDVRQRGLIAGIELVADKTTKASYPSTAQVGAPRLQPGARLRRACPPARRRPRYHAPPGHHHRATRRDARRAATMCARGDGGRAGGRSSLHRPT